jgi:hypothetical protein
MLSASTSCLFSCLMLPSGVRHRDIQVPLGQDTWDSFSVLAQCLASPETLLPAVLVRSGVAEPARLGCHATSKASMFFFPCHLQETLGSSSWSLLSSSSPSHRCDALLRSRSEVVLVVKVGAGAWEATGNFRSGPQGLSSSPAISGHQMSLMLKS